MKWIFNNFEVEGINIVIFVGGFVRSYFVFDFMKKIFNDKRIIIFIDLDLVVLKGVVKFGYVDWNIGMVVCGYIYGIESNRYCFLIDLVDKIKIIGG